MYFGSKFNREQLVFMAELILVSALDRIESCSPTGGTTTWEDRLRLVNEVHDHAKGLTAYEAGALETAGMGLAVLYAQTTGDGMGIYDSLVCADNFEEAVDDWVTRTWHDKGEAVRAKMKELGSGGWQIEEVYENYPNCRHHAEDFVDQVFGDYLARPDVVTTYTREDVREYLEEQYDIDLTPEQLDEVVSWVIGDIDHSRWFEQVTNIVNFRMQKGEE